MNTKVEVAADLLARVGQQRIQLSNSEKSIIPAALRAGLSVERVAHLAGATAEHVEEIRREVEGVGEDTHD